MKHTYPCALAKVKAFTLSLKMDEGCQLCKGAEGRIKRAQMNINAQEEYKRQVGFKFCLDCASFTEMTEKMEGSCKGCRGRFVNAGNGWGWRVVEFVDAGMGK